MNSQDFDEKHLNSDNQQDSPKFLTKVSRYKIDRLSSREHRRKSQKDQAKRVGLLSLFTKNSYEGKGFWNSEERARYLQFLDQQKALWTNETRRKDWKAMSKFIRTRSPAQCQAYYYFQINRELYKAKLKLKKELKRKLKSKLKPGPKSQEVSHSESSQEPVQKFLFTMDEIHFLLEANKIELENQPEIKHETNLPATIKNEFNPSPSETIKNAINVPEEFKNEEIRHFSMPTQSYLSQNTSENSEKINKGPWSSEEQALYFRFIEQYKALGKNDDRRKARFYFNLMSASIRTRDPAQCKSHDQKIRRKLDKLKPECEANLPEIIENEVDPSETIKYEVKTTKVKKEEKIEDLSITVKPEFHQDFILKSEPSTDSGGGLLDLKPKIEMELENEPWVKREACYSETTKNELNSSEIMKHEPNVTEVIKEEKIEDLSIPVKLEFPEYINNIQNSNLGSVWPLAFFLNMYAENNFIIPYQVQQKFESMNSGQDDGIIPKIEDNMRY